MDTTAACGGFRELLRTCRRAAGVTQRQLADRVGISLAAIRDLEQGRTRRPHRRFVDAMVTALGLTGDAAAAFRQAASDTDQARPAGQVGPDHPVRVGILGPLSAYRGSQHVLVGRGRRRAVLGRLALSANAVVPMADLVDLLWDTHPPPAAAHAVQTYVSRLRSTLQPAGPGRTSIVTRSAGGYQLNLDDNQLDLADFRRHVRQARTAEPAQALDMLEAALALWWDSPLADVPQLRDHSLVAAVVNERIAATLRYAELALTLRRPDRCLPRLRELATANPLHEPLHARLMAVLAADNLQADALTTYADIRKRLVEELGIEPGPDLVEVHRRVLRQEPAVPMRESVESSPSRTDQRAVPAQLPADIRHFTGRAGALARLDGILDAHGQAPAVVITAVSGTAGVGKTALAVHWAHLVRHRFPDGQLYINLRGFDPAATMMEPITAIRSFLDALGVVVERVPVTLEAAEGLYRSLLADRRMLIVLDNARDTDQIRPLLPGSAGCLVVATSRNALAGLVAIEGAYPITLDLPSTDEALQLLTVRLGADRVSAEPHATGEIIERCARLPLTLAIVAARATARPDFPLAALADQLRDCGAGLDTWSDVDPAVDVRAVFSWSYQVLSPTAARVFRLLGLHPGPDITVPAAASLAGLPAAQVRSLLAKLAHAHLLIEHTLRRYTFHDLLRTYAIELTHSTDTAAERHEAVRRFLDHCLHSAFAAARDFSPHRDPIVLAPLRDRVSVEDFRDDQHAMTWLGTEHRVLLGALDLATRSGLDEYAEPFAWTLTDFLQRNGHWQDQAAVHTAALAATQRLGDHRGQARAHRHLSRACILLGRLDDAHAHYQHALDLSEQIGDASGRAHVHLNVANLFERQERHLDALDHAQKALSLFANVENPSGQARARNMVGWFHARLGRHRQALVHCELALAELQDINDGEGQVFTLDSLGYVHHHLGQHEQAIVCYQRALGLAQQLGDRYAVAEVLIHLGDAHQSVGDTDAAREVWQRGLDILDEFDHPDAEQVRAKLKQP